MSVCTARSQEARKEIKRLEGGRKGKMVIESIATIIMKKVNKIE